MADLIPQDKPVPAPVRSVSPPEYPTNTGTPAHVVARQVQAQRMAEHQSRSASAE